MDPRVTVAGEVEKEKAVPGGRSKAILAGGVALILVVIAGLIWNFYFRPPPIEPASVEKMAFPLPDKPSIAVLPFVNMSDDPKQEFFSDGITEDIITALSKTPRLFVIARNSTFVYKGKPTKIQKVAEDLGVRYVLEGSVRKSENKVRVTAQLIDALKGTHLWAEKYDRDQKDIFAIQDDITREIIEALQVKLTEGEQARIWSRGTENTKAHEKALESLEHFRRFNPDNVILCRKKAEEALALDPNYPFAVALLAWSHLIEVWNGWSKSPGESMKKAVELAKKTVELDDNYEGGHAILGSVYLIQKQWEKAVEEGERAVELSPSGADANGILGITLSYVGRPKEAISLLEKAIRLNPSSPNWLYHNLGRAQILVGNYQEAITSFKRVIEKNPKHIPASFFLIVAYSLSNQDKEAKIQVEEYLKQRPSANIESWKKRSTFKNETDTDLFVNALRKAGFPETPPLPVPEKPSIAVLPFANISGDPKEDYLSDGITEQIITALSKTPKLFVIARNSVFTYKGKPVMVQQVGKDLGVRYVLEGSVQKSGDRIRITAQLIDAKTGNHLWAEKFDRDLKDIFAIQDEITKKIITSVHVKLTEGEQGRLYAKGTANLDAYLKASEASWYLRQSTKEGLLKAKQLAEDAIALDPNYPSAYNTLGMFYGISIWLGMSKSPADSLKRAIELSQKAIALDKSFAAAHVALGYWLTMARQYDKAISEGERAMALEPGSADVIQNYAMILTYAGRFEEAIPLFREALRLNPMPTNSYYRHFGLTLREAGHYEEAIAVTRKAIDREPNDLLANVGMTVHYTYAGRMEQARMAAKEVLRINAAFSADKFGKVIPMKDPAVTVRIVEALKKAGLK
ncbi:MAG: tetratricopeptide repeat protein [Desulfobacteraceae bacterium]|nr:tetratricopeptide repeat protein [Desulfobacteraceae bacterium]